MKTEREIKLARWIETGDVRWLDKSLTIVEPIGEKRDYESSTPEELEALPWTKLALDDLEELEAMIERTRQFNCSES